MSARGPGDVEGPARGLGKLSPSPRDDGLRARLLGPTRRRDTDDEVAAPIATAKAEFVDEGSDRKWWTRVPSLPTESEVPGFDLVTNWGATPEKMRPLFALMEEVSKIRGSARIFALISMRESSFQAAAHNDSPLTVCRSQCSYMAYLRNRPLTHGQAAAEFGTGGLFGALAPDFLWSAAQEMEDDAPLLTAPPEVMYIPRIAAFGAVVYLQQLISSFRIDDLADIRVGWGCPDFLGDIVRGTMFYETPRKEFFADAAQLGVDLDDTVTIPKHLRAASWPGAATVFTSLTRITVQEATESPWRAHSEPLEVDRDLGPRRQSR